MAAVKLRFSRVARTGAASLRATASRAALSPGMAPQEERDERANKWTVLALAGVATFMTTLDASIVNISLPAIAHTFGVALTGAVEWVIICYLVVSASVLLTFGRLADMLGRKPIFLVGLVIFTLGSILCGAAPSLGILIAARGFQGLGASLLFAVNVAMISSAFPPSERGRAFGTNAILLALGISAGPTIGGIITEHLTWRWIFYVNVPIGIVVVTAAVFALTERLHREPATFDLFGASLLAVGVAGLTLGLSFGVEWGWLSWQLIMTMAVAVAAFIGVAFTERRAQAPILNPRLLRNRVFILANVSFILCMLALFAVGFMLPFYFEQLRGFDTQKAGLLLTPLPLTLAVVAPISGALADRFGSRWLAPIGLGVACLGLVLLSQLNADSTVPDIIWRLVVTGIGQGLFQSPNASTIMGAAPRDVQGVASGFLATGRIIGQSVSVALAGAVFAAEGGNIAGNLLANHGQPLSPAHVAALQQTFVGALHAAFLVCAAFAAIGIVSALARGQVQQHAAA